MSNIYFIIYLGQILLQNVIFFDSQAFLLLGIFLSFLVYLGSGYPHQGTKIPTQDEEALRCWKLEKNCLAEPRPETLFWTWLRTAQKVAIAVYCFVYAENTTKIYVKELPTYMHSLNLAILCIY